MIVDAAKRKAEEEPVKGRNAVMCDLVLVAASVAFLSYSYAEFSGAKTALRRYGADVLNNTARSDPDGLVFNRVPKVGSETVWSLIDKLAGVNNFTSYSDSASVKDQRGGENNYLPDPAARLHYFEMIEQNLTKPWSYVKHLNFLDFTEYKNSTNPVYINFVRHPVERIPSWYYYHRAPWHILRVNPNTNATELKGIGRSLSTRGLKTSFEDCFRERLVECRYYPGNVMRWSPEGGSHYSQIFFYCGMSEDCAVFESEKALAIAKHNVERYYAVVGVLEWMQDSLYALEEYVPRYFRGARRVFGEMQSKNRNTFKPKTDPAILEALKSNFTLEIEFYEFCKQRLRRQLLALP